MAKRQFIPLLAILLSLGLSSCGGQSSSVDSTLYASEDTFDYSLSDDPLKGRAVYPDEALRILRQIKNHNSEEGITWPEGRYASVHSDVTIDGPYIGEYHIDEEYYIPGQYYLWQEETPWLGLSAEGFYMLDGEFFHGFRDLDDANERYHVPSSVEEMEEHWANNNYRETHYQTFLGLVEEIESDEFSAIAFPKDFTCYSRKAGDVFINIFHRTVSPSGDERRVIARIVYENYFPVQATYQIIDSIFGDDDYFEHSRGVKFEFGGVVIREDLDTFFGERRDA